VQIVDQGPVVGNANVAALEGRQNTLMSSWGVDRWTKPTKQQLISEGLRSPPASTSHRFDDGGRREVVEVAGRSGDARVARFGGR